MIDGKQEENSATGNRTVGVIVPMYNSTATIGETIQSIAAQTYTDLDIVVVDDGSTDDSAAKVREWQARDPRIRLVSQPNAGVAAVRNTGAGSVAHYFYSEVTGRQPLEKPSEITYVTRALLRTSLEKGKLGLVKKRHNQKIYPYFKLRW